VIALDYILIDILTLFLPLLLAVLSWWVKEYFSHRKERKSKQEIVWRLLQHNIKKINNDLIAFESVIQAFGKGEYAGVTDDWDHSIKKTLQRLTELDTANSHKYSEYEYLHVLIINGFKTLSEIQTSIITVPGINEERARNAMISQINVISETMIEIGEISICIMKLIKKDNKYNKLFQQQLIDTVKNNFEQIKSDRKPNSNTDIVSPLRLSP